MDSKPQRVGVAGAGTMGAGIAQLAAAKGHSCVLFDVNQKALDGAQGKIEKILDRLVEKGRMTQEQVDNTVSRLEYSSETSAFAGSDLVIEAIVENLDIKKKLFSELEGIAGDDAILATNTSSLSIASISSALVKPERLIGIHFFNPAPLMPLVEIIPGLDTTEEVLTNARKIIDSWDKVTVVAKDTPGFIVNRIARPFYSESIRILEEGMADASTIDAALKEEGGFRMGPFELMDFIGNDINLKVTETVFAEFFYDPRFKPSLTQKRLVEAGRLGRKSGRGYYDYREGATNPEPDKTPALQKEIVNRVICMLINEACDARFLNVATAQDIELAMTKGVNYPSGLLAWGDEIGPENVLQTLAELQAEYGEDRYRPNPFLRRVVRDGGSLLA